MLTILEPPVCECAAKGIPEGYICGKPDCPRVVAANAMLVNIHQALYGDKDDGEQRDPVPVRPL